VLWLSAALSAIAFSLASSVRGETERTAAALDGVRSYYLATGAIERALLYMQWGPGYRLPDGSPRYYAPGMSRLSFAFPSGEAVVEVIPESSKMNINFAPPEDLFRLLVNLGAEPERAREIALGIVDWRSPAPRAGPTPFDQYYLSLAPSFLARHASFEEIEEVLLVKGMTPQLFYGTYERSAQGQLMARGGLKDCITVYGALGAFDVNTAEPAVLAAAGLSPELVAAIVQTRRRMPFRDQGQLAQFLGGAGPAMQRLRVGGNTIYTLRATARQRLAGGGLSDLRRSVAAVVKLSPYGWPEPYHVLRWYDQVWSR
jgi:general secretion pathway protein K